jgi:hypothetical protein
VAHTTTSTFMCFVAGYKARKCQGGMLGKMSDVAPIVKKYICGRE